MAIFVFKEKEDGTINALVTGKVSREPEIRQNAKGDVIKFSVAFGKKKYMNVEAWSDSDVGAVAGCLEKGDVVLASGTYSEWEYNGRQYSRMTADIILPMQTTPAPVMQNNIAAVEPDERDKLAAGEFTDLYDDDGELPFE